jgi:hypothetical protein
MNSGSDYVPIKQLYKLFPCLGSNPESYFSDFYIKELQRRSFWDPDPERVKHMARMDAELAKKTTLREFSKFVFLFFLPSPEQIVQMIKMDAEFAKKKEIQEATNLVFARELFRMSDANRHNIGIMPSNTGQVFIEYACQEDENLELEFTKFLLPSFNICHECTFPIGSSHQCPHFQGLVKLLDRMKLPISEEELIEFYPCNGMKEKMEKLIQKTLPITLHVINELKNRTHPLEPIYMQYWCEQECQLRFDIPATNRWIYFGCITPFP